MKEEKSLLLNLGYKPISCKPVSDAFTRRVLFWKTKQGDVKEKKMFLVCNKCKLAYPILDDVPDMLIEDAWQLKKAKANKFKHKLTL